MVIQYDKIPKIPKDYLPEIILDGYGYMKKCVLEENAKEEIVEILPNRRKGKRVLGGKLKKNK